MLKNHPKAGRLVRLPSRIVSIVGFDDGCFLIRCGAKKIEKITEDFMMTHAVLVPKDCREEKKPAPKQDYTNKLFKAFFEEREKKAYQEKILEGFSIDDEVVEGFEAIAEEY